MSGTSMATPQKAGLLASWRQALNQQALLVNAALVSGRLLAVARTGGLRQRSRLPIGGSESQLHLASRGGGARVDGGWYTITAAPVSVPGLESGQHTDQLSPGFGCRAKWS